MTRSGPEGAHDDEAAGDLVLVKSANTGMPRPAAPRGTVIGRWYSAEWMERFDRTRPRLVAYGCLGRLATIWLAQWAACSGLAPMPAASFASRGSRNLSTAWPLLRKKPAISSST